MNFPNVFFVVRNEGVSFFMESMESFSNAFDIVVNPPTFLSPFK